MYRCPNPDCNNENNFQADCVVHATEFINAHGEVWDNKLYDSEQTGAVECSWCGTKAIEED